MYDDDPTWWLSVVAEAAHPKTRGDVPGALNADQHPAADAVSGSDSLSNARKRWVGPRQEQPQNLAVITDRPAVLRRFHAWPPSVQLLVPVSLLRGSEV